MTMKKIVIGTANFGMDYGIGHNQNKLIDSDISNKSTNISNTLPGLSGIPCLVYQDLCIINENNSVFL